MSRNWTGYLTSAPTDAGRALVLQGIRLDEARRKLSENQYMRILARVGITPREAATLANIGRRLHRLLEERSNIRLPYRIRTLVALADLSVQQISDAARDGIIHPAMTEPETKALRPPSPNPVPNVIRPTDNWNFSNLRWPRIDGYDGHGYIPGDLYANCLWYYAKDNDAVLDPMAGSGMMLHVWQERHTWLENHLTNLTVAGSDLNPRGPYKDQIRQQDLLDGPPPEHCDYIIMDPPYPGLVEGQYGDSPNDLANMEPQHWIRAMSSIASAFHNRQPQDGRCTVIIPNSRNIVTGRRDLFPEVVRDIFRGAGYKLYDIAYASRRTQQKQGRRMSILNNRARRARVPMTDISEVLTFIKTNPNEPNPNIVTLTNTAL